MGMSLFCVMITLNEWIALGYVYTARLCAQFWFIALFFFLFDCSLFHSFFPLFSLTHCSFFKMRPLFDSLWTGHGPELTCIRKSAITKMWDVACWRTEVNMEATCCWCLVKAIEFKSRWWGGEHKDKRATFVITAFMEQRMLFCKEMYAETEPRAVGLWQVQSHGDFIRILRSLWLQ